MNRFNESTGVITPQPLYETVVEQHRTDICGLSKHEYIALELTKAWASTRCSSYKDYDTLVDAFEEILNEVKERNL